MSAFTTPSDDLCCTESTCRRPMARLTRFCPYCGKATSLIQQDSPSRPAQAKPPDGITPEIVPAAAASTGLDKLPAQEALGPVVSAIAPTAIAASETVAAVVQPLRRPIHPFVIAAGAIAALVLLVPLLRR